ncbi:MAG: hypothetical protein HS116_11905 [Planctomycetes bacterium]|nr:hypothetical protein [Planctomycetota bacterium]
MNLKTAAGVTAAYGLWVIAGGVWRYWEAASANALGFGLFMGVLALAGAWLLFKGARVSGLAVAALAVVFVGGFFATKGSKDGIDIRVAITLALSVAEAVVLILAWRGKRE